MTEHITWMLWGGLVLSMLTGCTGVVVLRHPGTGHVIDCRRFETSGPISAHAHVEQCVKAYEQAGYKVVGDSR